ncbi:alanine-rich protein [Mycobacterium tuberculosis]|nr:alanine-rich protein [Mycobacterium tuberculosis]
MRRRRPPHVNAPTPCDRGDVRPPGCPASIPGVEVAGGTRARLRVTADGLQALAGRCATLAGELSAAVAPSGAVLSWQANAVAVNAAHARAGAAAAAVSARMRATAAALGQAARRYAGQDTAAAAALGRYARGGPTDGYVGAAAAVGGAVDELCASERGRRPLAAAGHAVGARLSRGARFDAPTRRHRLGGPGRGPRPLPVDRRRGDDRSRGGPAA